MTRAPRWPALGAVAVLALGAGLVFGAVRLAPAAVWAGLTDAGSAGAPIVRGLRVPRVLLGFLVGGSLAVSGAVLQALIRNPLADPYLLGISGGAAIAAVLVIAAGAGAAWVLPLAAFAGAMAALLLVYRLSLVQGRRLDPHILLLAGVVVSAFTGALVSAVLTLSPAAQLRNAFLWMLGGLGGASGRRWGSSPPTRSCRSWCSACGRVPSTCWPWGTTPPATSAWTRPRSVAPPSWPPAASPPPRWPPAG